MAQAEVGGSDEAFKMNKLEIITAVSAAFLLIAGALFYGTREKNQVDYEALGRMKQLADLNGRDGTTSDELVKAFRILREELGYKNLHYNINKSIRDQLTLEQMLVYASYQESFRQQNPSH